LSDPIRRRTFSAKYRHRAWGVIMAVPASLATLLSVGFFIGTTATQDTFYLPSAITFLIPALALGLPAVYLLRGRDVNPRPAARKAAAAAQRELQIANRQAQQAARHAELMVRQQTAEAQRDAAVAQREAAQAELRVTEARRVASLTEQQAFAVGATPASAQPDGSVLAPVSRSTSSATFAPEEWAAGEVQIKRIAGYMRVSGILWLVLGIIQVVVGVGFAFAAGLTLTLVIVGVWNIVAATSRLNSVALIKARDSSVPASWEGIAGLVIVGVANLLIGGLVGVALVIFDFVVRDHILKNRALFTTTGQPILARAQGPS
jgi:hypothetical protein